MLLFTNQRFATSTSTSYKEPEISPQKAITGRETSFKDIDKDIVDSPVKPATTISPNVLSKTVSTFEQNEEPMFGQPVGSSGPSIVLRQYLRSPIIKNIFT